MTLIYSIQQVNARNDSILYISGGPSTTSISIFNQLSAGTRVVESMDQARAAGQQIVAIILDTSSIEIVDTLWLAEKYRQGITIAFVNVSSSRAARILQDKCVLHSNISGVDDFIVATLYIEGESADEVGRLRQHHQDTCGETQEPLNDITSPLYRYYGYSSGFLPDGSFLLDLVREHTVQIKESRERFRSEKRIDH